MRTITAITCLLVSGSVMATPRARSAPKTTRVAAPPVRAAVGRLPLRPEFKQWLNPLANDAGRWRNLVDAKLSSKSGFHLYGFKFKDLDGENSMVPGLSIRSDVPLIAKVWNNAGSQVFVSKKTASGYQLNEDI